jgi:hypothetical protein
VEIENIIRSEPMSGRMWFGQFGGRAPHHDPHTNFEEKVGNVAPAPFRGRTLAARAAERVRVFGIVGTDTDGHVDVGESDVTTVRATRTDRAHRPASRLIRHPPQRTTTCWPMLCRSENSGR